jgi:hypothetical protein
MKVFSTFLSGVVLAMTLSLSQAQRGRSKPKEFKKKLRKLMYRPSSLTFTYIGGQGKISAYQDEDKASCRDQTFPVSTTITDSYDNTYQVTTGSSFTITEDFDAETEFFFDTGGVPDCYIHTSCSQPLMAGDQIGPFLLMGQGDLCEEGAGVPDQPQPEPEPGDCEVICEICTPENKQRPVELTLRYEGGGPGKISGYQDEDKASCRDQIFPDIATITDSYGNVYQVSPGTIFTVTGKDPGDDLDAETEFYFTPPFDGTADPEPNGCYIHTSCSQPLVAGDQMGPFLILAGNNCVYTPCYCGDGVLDTEAGEECDEGADMPSDTCVDCKIPPEPELPVCGDNITQSDNGETCDPPGEFTINGTVYMCRADCTYCGDERVNNAEEECDEGDDMPSETCVDCKTVVPPDCGDGEINQPDETCDPPGEFTTNGAAYVCRADCTYCGDGMVNGDEECDGPGANGLPCRDDCRIPRCGDEILDTGETCDPPGSTTPGGNVCRDDCTSCGDGMMNSPDETCDEGDMNGTPNSTCRAGCTYCGDGIVNEGEECDPADTDPNAPNCNPDCTECLCQASATYNDSTGAVTIEFDMCGADSGPMQYDFIGIYPCNVSTMNATQEWWNATCNAQATSLVTCDGTFQLGLEEDQVYPNRFPTWLSYTCGSPGVSTCQQDRTIQWPTNGMVTIDPAVCGSNSWACGGCVANCELEPGCYKAVLHREMPISPPPYPYICEDWFESSEFTVGSSSLPDVGGDPEPDPEPDQDDLCPEPACRDLGLKAPCCPTEQGVILYCCTQETTTTTIVRSEETAGQSGSSRRTGFCARFVFLVSLLATCLL